MRIIHSAEEFDGNASVVALGMFDGVHIGHQKLIRTAVGLARELKAVSIVCTFDRHPLSVLCPERAPQAILPLEENLKKFEKLGTAVALVESFTPEFSAIPPEDYLRLLAKRLRARAIVVGENHTFGQGGRGNASLIRNMADALGYRAVVVPPVMDGDVAASSTDVRALRRAGAYEHAQRLLDIQI